jgi:hypothetical protein
LLEGVLLVDLDVLMAVILLEGVVLVDIDLFVNLNDVAALEKTGS